MTRPQPVEAVVKIGGGALADPAALSDALAAIATLSRRMRVVIVPGGGPFADTVRNIDARVILSGDAAHWMAVLAMDQYAELLVSRLAGAVRVETAAAIAAAIADGAIPVLAPSRWLREADPLPHSWAVTSDSIAAWVSGALGARLLILIKPRGAQGSMVDQYFEAALPPRVTPVVIPVDQAEHMLSEAR
jgi:5-(aminomethyl)-3-furanmethanol phosphate kinase